MMGHSGNIPGAILAKDVPEALSCLKQSIASYQGEQKQVDSDNDYDLDEQDVSLDKRAYPLIELLEGAVKADCDVMWRKS
jgi:hypothetical protein